MLLRVLLVVLPWFSILSTKGQNTIALPEIINYSREVYNAGTQNWKIAQDKRGIMYYANNEGLLTFDGNFWKKYIIPGNSSGIQSLAIDESGRIYVGAQAEIGYFEPGAQGRLQYTSLNKLIPDSENDFSDVWDVVLHDKGVFFRSFKKIFRLKNGKVNVYSDLSWAFMGESNGQLIAQNYANGLLQFKEDRWVPILQTNNIPVHAQVASIIPLAGDSSLVLIKRYGSFILHRGRLTPFNTASMQDVTAQNPYAATVLNNDLIAIATSLGGCYIINKKGQFIQRLSRREGVQNNNILSVFVDSNKNLWLGLDNGVSFVLYDNAIKHIYPDYQERSAGKSAIIFNDQLYIGTSNGLYRASMNGQQDISLSQSDFELIPGTKGQVWSLADVNGHLLMGHNNGFFEIKNNHATLVDRSADGSTGCWTFLPLGNIGPAKALLTGTYNGVNYYSYTNGKFQTPPAHNHIESIRYIATDNNIAWAAHPFKGLYRISLDTMVKPRFTAYQDKKGILSVQRNYIFSIRNRIVLTNEKGIFEYNAATGDFDSCYLLTEVFGNMKVQYLHEDADGNIWFIEEKRLGVVDYSGKKPEIVRFPELNSKIMGNGFEYIFTLNSNNIFVAGEEGFYHINYRQYKGLNMINPVLIADVKIINKSDSSIFGGFVRADMGAQAIKPEVPRINYNWNSVHFDYSSALYARQSGVEYSYYLEDFDAGWSPWSRRPEKDYTYLPPGSYTFHVKARTHEGIESGITAYRFVILAPWYRTRGAYALYIAAALLVIFMIYRFQRRKFLRQQMAHEEERRRLEYLNQLQIEKHTEEQKQLAWLHQLELERNEKEIMQLKNESLKSEIETKNTELASTALNLIQKDETLMKVKEEFMRLKKVKETDKESEEYKKIVRMLGDNNMKKNWDQFAIHFNKVHDDFLLFMKKQYPKLTASDLKLCAYLRLNLSSKDIAQIMNITIKSVELSRYRLRKKLQVPTGVSLFDFLLNFQAGLKKY
jgi:DNA-binding CsgD family transcriptional regulator